MDLAIFICLLVSAAMLSPSANGMKLNLARLLDYWLRRQFGNTVEVLKSWQPVAPLEVHKALNTVYENNEQQGVGGGCVTIWYKG